MIDNNTIYGLIFTALFGIGPIMQIVKIYKNKSSNNVSIGMYIMGIFAQLTVILYMNGVGGGIWNYITSVLGIIYCVITLICIRKYD